MSFVVTGCFCLCVSEYKNGGPVRGEGVGRKVLTISEGIDTAIDRAMGKQMSLPTWCLKNTMIEAMLKMFHVQSFILCYKE